MLTDWRPSAKEAVHRSCPTSSNSERLCTQLRSLELAIGEGDGEAASSDQELKTLMAPSLRALRVEFLEKMSHSRGFMSSFTFDWEQLTHLNIRLLYDLWEYEGMSILGELARFLGVMPSLQALFVQVDSYDRYDLGAQEETIHCKKLSSLGVIDHYDVVADLLGSISAPKLKTLFFPRVGGSLHLLSRCSDRGAPVYPQSQWLARECYIGRLTLLRMAD